MARHLLVFRQTSNSTLSIVKLVTIQHPIRTGTLDVRIAYHCRLSSRMRCFLSMCLKIYWLNVQVDVMVEIAIRGQLSWKLI